MGTGFGGITLNWTMNKAMRCRGRRFGSPGGRSLNGGNLLGRLQKFTKSIVTMF